MQQYDDEEYMDNVVFSLDGDGWYVAAPEWSTSDHLVPPMPAGPFDFIPYTVSLLAASPSHGLMVNLPGNGPRGERLR